MSQEALPEWATKGKFESRFTFPADMPIMIHASVLPEGKVIFWGREKEVVGNDETIYDVVGHSKVLIWDPVTDVIETVDNGTTNLFCSGHSLLPDGRLFVTGGHEHPHPNSQVGDDHTNLFDPATRSWSPLAPAMEKGRWYPSNLTLETGEVAILAGLYQTGTQTDPTLPPPVGTQMNPEIYTPATNALEVMAPSSLGLPTYPYVFLDPLTSDDETSPRGVFIAGPRNSYFWSPRGGQDGKGLWSLGTGLSERFQDGSAVMYDSEQGSVLMVGGRSNSGEAITSAKTITLNQPNPQWVTIPGMAHPRSWHSTTLLPDGKVLVTGGTPCYGGQLKTPCYVRHPSLTPDTYDVGITREAEMWSPATGWQTMATAEKTRGYHSVALLLPDATVLVGGYGYPDGVTTPPDPDPFQTPPPPPDAYLRRQTTGERNVEIYKPPYLFDSSGNEAPRPEILTAPIQVGYGQPFSLSYGNATAINRVSWVRLPSITHGINQDQRINVLSFTPGASPDQLTVTAPSDPRKCPPGYYMLFVFDAANVPSKAKIVRISDEVVPSLSIDDVSQLEGDAGTKTFTFTVSLTVPAPAGGVSFDIATADGTATAASGDYVAKVLTGQMIPENGTSYTFPVVVNGDTNIEPDERFFVNVTNVTGIPVADGQGAGNILTDDQPRLSINDVAQTEGNAGTKNFTFTVSLSAPAPAGEVSFNIATADGTATAASGDYVAKTLTGQTIPAGSSSSTFIVTVNGDTLIEPTETFFVNVTNVTGATVTDGQGVGTILLDDLPSLSINDIARAEGNTGTTSFTFTVSLSAPAPAAISFNIATADGTATAASGDYVAKALTAQTIPAGSTSYTFTVAVNGDASVESTETFFVNVTNVSGATVTDGQGTGTIQNDDAPTAGIYVVGVSQAEGNAGTTNFNFTVALTAPTGAVSFDIATADGTATAASGDYVAKSLTGQTIPAGSTSYTFPVAVKGDTLIEPTEAFFVNLTNIVGASVTGSTAEGTILNDEAVPSLSINNASQLEGNTGTKSFTFTVSLSAPAPAGGVGFSIATADGMATAASGDYVAKSLTGQSIPAGSSSYTFTVTVNGDTNVEADEAFAVNVTNVTNATVNHGQGTGTIQNDDQPTAGIYVVGVTQAEGHAGTTNFNFTVRLTAPTGAVSFDIATADGTATAASGDYVAKALTGQIIPAGSTSYTFPVTVKGDTNVEPTETFFVNLTNIIGASITGSTAQGTILTDD
jgi:hypothetical protein